jgi:UDPglucose--hexose-1-phosphate uridylyltransferase
MTDYPHRRRNPLTGEWVLVSPHRARRPWQGREEQPPPEDLPTYDPGCYLCPGNERAGGRRNPDYTSTFVFTNDFSALLEDTPPLDAGDDPLFGAEGVEGTCRVLCFSPRHDLTLARMSHEEIERVIALWAEQFGELGEKYRWVEVFENRGAMMGSSNPHPHGQIWATDALPSEPEKEDRMQRAYYEAHGTRLLVDYAREEINREERVVVQNEDWVAVVPFWAGWPYETLLMPRQPVRQLTDLSRGQHGSLARILKALLIRYDNLFEVSFPYGMGWHGAPSGGTGRGDHWQLHAHFYPPLLRSATVRKFRASYELLAEPQNDLAAETAARTLRELPARHYTERVGGT